ncbi:MAG: 50S ribosomal protein L6 [Chloroflexota bacterium]
MSRIGRAPIPLPSGVDVAIDKETNTVTVKGPKGQLVRKLHRDMNIEREDGNLLVQRPSDSNEHRALHGLTRSLVANMVIGVTTGFRRELQLTGVGYRVMKQGDRLLMQLGFSHPIEIVPPTGVEITDVQTFTPTTANQWMSARFAVAGIDKEQVGQLAALIRRLRKPDPYKGKGIRYTGEIIRRKAGKAAGKGKK